MRNSALKWLVSLVLPTAVATVTATVFVLSITHTPRDENAAPDKTASRSGLPVRVRKSDEPARAARASRVEAFGFD
jgi:hypothetical protein